MTAPIDPTQWVRLRGLYGRTLRAQCEQQEPNDPHAAQSLFTQKIYAAEPLTISGNQLDHFDGPVPTASDVPIFIDRHTRTYVVTSDDKVRLAD
ncbi:hypothetical protein MBOE_47580 [Mycolicibacterium boenickei]|uniref:Uncharacterized protein n=1 Tax=Mycolicibacterium boenickei TaxID=146017 RepID=A0ABM7J1S2_9MYCO|nr:hypothetical protein MBOE_47580 [Mycolicibacterium boenickei]